MLESHIHQHKISPTTLEKINLLELIHNTYSSKYPTIKKYIIARYPYYSELHTLNALEGLALFTHEFANKTRYFVLAGGLEQLITKIQHHLEQSPNVKIHLNTPLETIARNIGLYSITPHGGGGNVFQAERVILALPQPALTTIRYLTSRPGIRQLINSVAPEPLYRIYARYPPDGGSGKVWFADMPKIVSNLSIKYIIPSNVEKGIIMISYTDARFARYWFKKLEAGEDILKKELARQLKLLFPDVEIPTPLWIKHYYWDMGAGYWKPRCSRKELIPRITQPLEDEPIYICNENYSSHQAWVEGSLESADYVLAKLGIPGIGVISRTKHYNGKTLKNKPKHKQKHIHNKQLRNRMRGGGATKKWKTYTLAEVAKHNKKTDAWIAIDGKVADITEWIPKHPGGAVIMKGVGKDATALFTSIGHDEYARKMLKKYQIGILVEH